MPTLTEQILAHLRDYLAGRISLEALQDWLVPNTWNIDRVTEPAANLAYGIDFRIAEYSSGQWTEVELKELLSALLPEHARPAASHIQGR